MNKVNRLDSDSHRERKIGKYIITRWSIPFAGFLLALMGGFSYAWGVFIQPMEEKFGWTTTEATLPFTVFVMIFAIFMIPAGRIQDKIGPRRVSAIGAVLFFVSYGLAALVDRFPYPWWLVVTYSVIGGIACGLTYACVAPPARKWFPDKPGLAISFGVSGFGLAALVLAPLKAEYLIPVYGIEGTFFIIAIITSVVCLFAAWLIRNPPAGWTPSGWESGKKVRKTIMVRQESIPKEMIRSPIFQIMWPAMALVCAGGLICIGLIPSYGNLIIGLTGTKAALAISIFAGFNGFGRPVAGLLSDRFGAVQVMIITYIIQTMTFLFFHIFAVTQLTLYIASALLGWGYAVTLALFPTLISICFGIKNLGVNYGILITAFGIGGLAPAVGSWIFDVTGSYTPAFFSAGIMAGISLGLCVVLKKKYALS
jgi:OFA family oxalate/formate antiporter-like MFS transporter